MRRVIFCLVFGFAAFVLAPVPPDAVADEIAVTSHLDPWSINGALFATSSEGVAGVDIPGTCLAAYNEWEQLRRADHQEVVDVFVDAYRTQVAANEEAIAAGEDPPYPAVPPVGSMTESAFVRAWMSFAGMPYDVQDWIEEIWEPMEYAPGTNVPCLGKGVLPAPPGGFLGINLGDEPPDPDPCTPLGHLPFSPAKWWFYPDWHEDAPLTDAGDPYSGIKTVYDTEDGEIVFSWVPIVIGVQLVVECLAIFPDDEATGHFEELLPAATLTIVPENVGVTGFDTKLWYDFADPDSAIVGPIDVAISHRGTDWVLTAYAWVDAAGWDLDFDGSGDPAWDEAVDFPDSAWVPATAAEYAALGGSLDEPARVYVYEEKDFYTIATGVTWRGYYVVDEIGAIGWGFTEQYQPVTRWTILPYQVDEIVGRRN